MEERSVGDVLYEERRHASGPYSSHYPPLPPKSNDGGNGGFLSFLSIRGISQLKEKWSGQSNQANVKKPASLFISPRGEHVAVATGSQITILQKEDDYQEPSGIFNGGSSCLYTCGTWSESHNVLGVVDNMDTMYFIKASGVQIAQFTKRQLKISSPIIGLIPQDCGDGLGSCVCSFVVVTSDGLLHHVDVGREPSSGCVSNSSSAAKPQFPKDVFCFQYAPENSLLLVVGGIGSDSVTSGRKPGCHLSLWRRCQNLNLEQLSTLQFEGQYYRLQDAVKCLAYPKVLISPESQFVSTLDGTGHLHVFRMDKESWALSSFDNVEGSTPSAANNLLNEQNAYLNDILDFTWWSNHIMTVINRGGIVMMLDMLSGTKVLEHDLAYSMPMVDRAQEIQGSIFLLESKSSDHRTIPSDHIGQLSDSQGMEEKAEDSFDQFDVSRMSWSLMSLSQKSVHEMYSILIGNGKYQSALDFANRYGLQKDEVFKSQWLQSPKRIKDVNMYLTRIKDSSFVLSECRERIGPTEDDMKALLAHGIGVSNQFRFSEEENYDSHLWDFRIARLQLLQSRDRLETFLGINMGRFSVQEYCKFRVTPLEEVAVILAESGKIGALNLLFKRHPYSLYPFMLQVLAAIPETTPVQTYGQLLPGKSPLISIALREEDWVECEVMVRFINQLSDSHEMGIQIRTESIVQRCNGHLWPSTAELSIWYKKRARDIDYYTGQLENCLCLLDFACRKGVTELEQFHQDISYLCQLIYSDDSDSDMCFDMSLVAWEELSDYEKFRMMLKNVKVENVVKRLNDKGIPFMLSKTSAVSSATMDQLTDHRSSLHEENTSFLIRWLKEMAVENKLDICLKVIEEGCKELGNAGFFKDDTEAIECALQCIYLCTVTDRWSTMSAILSKLPQKQEVRALSGTLEKRLKLAEGHIEIGRLLSFYQDPKQMSFFLEAHVDEKEIKQAKDCLSLFPGSRNVQAEADIILALTVKLPNLGVTLLPEQYRQIKDPMEIIKMIIAGQNGAYIHVDEVIEVAKLLGLSSPYDISAVEEAIAREAAVADDLQLAFDLCLVLCRKGHGPVWDLCATIARGPVLENMEISSRKQLIGFALSHCDEESIMELLHAWKDLDMQGHCEALLNSSNSFGVSSQGSSNRQPLFGSPDTVHHLGGFSELTEDVSSGDQEAHLRNTANILLSVARHCLAEEAVELEYFLKDNGRLLAFAASQLPRLLELSCKSEYSKNSTSGFSPGKQFVSIRSQALVTVLSWLGRHGFSPRDSVIASVAKSIIESPVTEEEDVMGCSFLLNLVDAFSGVVVIEEQLRLRENYYEMHSIMNVGMTYSALHSFGVECKDPSRRRELLLTKFKEKHAPLSLDEINKMDKVQPTFWREWKLKLEEKKRIAEKSRVLEQVIPGVDTARFLSADLSYIRHSVFGLIESVRLERKHIIKDVLELADTYGLNRNEVLRYYLSCILASEAWTNDDIVIEISEFKGEIIISTDETIKTVSSVVYPAIDGHNKNRVSFIYALLSDCYFHLGKAEAPSPFPSPLSNFQLAECYKVIGQECQRVSFIQKLDFKNIAGLGGLNLQYFRDEVFANINDERSLEALAEMVKNLVAIHSAPVPQGMIVWQDVYKQYIQKLFTELESRAKTEFNVGSSEKFQEFIGQVEGTFGYCGQFISHLVTTDAMDVLKRCFSMILILPGAFGCIPDNSMWQECLIDLLNFWFRLSEAMIEIISRGSSMEKLSSLDPVCLRNCVELFVRFVSDDNVSPSQAWGTIIGYVNHGLIGDCIVEAKAFCRAMVFSGCSFGPVSDMFSEMTSHSAAVSSTAETNISQLYTSMLDSVLRDLINEGTRGSKDLYNLLSSLSKIEGNKVEDLQQHVRRVVWERLAQFCDDLQLPNNIRVYVLEIMQFIADRSHIKGFSAELQSNILPWEGWQEFLSTKNDSAGSVGLKLDCADNSNRFTSTLVALKSSQLVTAISINTEISPEDLSNTDTAFSCFSKLCELSSTDHHLDVLCAVLEEWEGLFATTVSEPGDSSVEAAEVAGNDWSNDDWNEGWESFQETDETNIPKEKVKVVGGGHQHLHPLHACWMQLFRKMIELSQVDKVLALVDQSLSKPKGKLIDENDARTLSESIVDSFVALKLVLLLPYEALWFQRLDVVDEKLKKQGWNQDTSAADHELLTLILSSGIVVSAIFTQNSYGTTFSYLCYLVGNFSRQCQESQLSKLAEKDTSSFLFARLLFPSFLSELVKADQHVLAGFLVTKFMHTNTSISVIDLAEASLRRYLEGQHRALVEKELGPDELSSCGILKNTVVGLRDKLVDSIPSVLLPV
ncbi:unnamed protein product [Linum tenue]|uniref:Sec39 domain-containing protein n=1 Tax=Linum tenue TaxID=586396 RepID=A0AAV0IIU3_9ROSI|nr:unnamed protein product [Linum tenue]